MLYCYIYRIKNIKTNYILHTRKIGNNNNGKLLNWDLELFLDNFYGSTETDMCVYNNYYNVI